ncbi:MAG: hypothetical protein NVSMB17_00550 [Candidatus Dormibacteria bacterium]
MNLPAAVLRRSAREAHGDPPPLRRERLTFRIVPLVMAAVLTVLLRVGPSIETVSREQLGSLLLVAFLPVTAYLVPWARLPRWMQAVPPLVSIPMYLVVLLGTHETELPYSPVLLLPLLFLGLYYTALEVGIGVLLMIAVTAAPPLLSGAGLGDRLLAIVYATVTGVAAVSVYMVTRSIRRHDSEVTSLANLLRESAGARDPAAARLAVCRAAFAAARAQRVALLEPGSGELRVTACWPPQDEGVPSIAIPLAETKDPAVRALNGSAAVLVLAPGNPPRDGTSSPAAAAWIPLIQQERAASVLVVHWDWPVRKVSSPEVTAVVLLAPEAALVIAHADAVQQLSRLALSDNLTGLPNRLVWERELPRSMAIAARSGEPLCVVALDLDHFKAFNDDWGHQMGDELLRTVSSSWRAVLREVDVLARFGGDEFGMILPGCTLAGAEVIAERLRETMAEGQTYSAGMAWWDGHESGPALFARADALLYECKRSGRGRVLTSNAAVAGNSLTDWTNLIPRIVQAQDLVSVYQPICRLEDRVVIGYEALARPSGQAADVSVDAMFAAAQRMGALRDLDWLARRTAVGGASQLPESALLFVNVGARALLDPVHDVDQMLLLAQWARRAPSSIVLEISEREVISDLARLRSVLAVYRREGFRFAMDDVGEGHLTLELLGAGDPEFVKIARSLTVEAAQGGQRGLVRALVEFATSAGAHVIAEGIETPAQLEAMRSLGVDMGQGYLLGRPAAMGHPVEAKPGVSPPR